ncbi:MAG: molecular chaperone HtpG [Bacteriovoracaceae bacterium]|nr:molecular chaperone HtpG [Bacteriovoracaceae bacterium]
MSHKGTIKVNTTDIFPIIKKWLYSEHDIYLRDLISNACDAITKRITLSKNKNQELPNPSVVVEINPEEKTITFIDNGLGMTEAEVEKYIAQLAFSGAEEFVGKMKAEGKELAKDDIIGKFGLGFYSAFMVADKVEIESLSMNEGAVATRWVCQGDTDYEFSASDKKDIGTSIKLFINAENEDFLQSYKTRSVIAKYCSFMPYPIELRDTKEIAQIEADNAKAAKPEDKKPLPNDIINDAKPLWKKDPATISDDDYKDFYRKLFPMESEPLFWLHLNVDHPFTLQGILYFPKISKHKPLNDNSIKLYCKQVFVSDNTKNIVPEFLGLLKGAIDSSDIPLNVSRSALQGDPNIKKISNYIIKKVAESLKKLFKNDRARYEQVWEDISLFVKYGCISDEKFDELMRSMVLFKNTEGKLVTLTEYQESIPEKYKEKLKDKVIYFEAKNADESLRKQLNALGVSVVETDDYIDPHFTQHCEMKKLDSLTFKFSAIDAEAETLLTDEAAHADSDKVQEMFNNVFGIKEDEKELEKKLLAVEIKNMKNSSSVAYLKQDHAMKKFQKMTQAMGNSPFDMPLKKTLVINPNHPMIQNALKLWGDDKKKNLVEKMCHHTLDLATLSSEGLSEKEKESFVSRSQELIQELSQYAL